jgi:hypothetical protein
MASKKYAIAVFLFGLTWAGYAQAGFLGNNLELQFLQSILNSYTVVVPPGGVTVNDPSGVSVNVGDTTVDVTVPNDVTDVGLKITDLTPSADPITGASGNGGDITNGSNFVEVDNLPSDGTTHVDVTFANSVPEPRAIDLFALGLAMMGAVAYLRRRRAYA